MAARKTTKRVTKRKRAKKRTTAHLPVKMTCTERIYTIEVLPQEGSVAELRFMRKLREKLSLSDAELRAVKFKQVGSRARWEDAGRKRLVKFTKMERRKICDGLSALQKQKKMRDELLGIWDMFMPKNEEDELELEDEE